MYSEIILYHLNQITHKWINYVAVYLKITINLPYQSCKMANNEDLEKRIKKLEREVQHLKEALQYQTKNKKKLIGD